MECVVRRLLERRFGDLVAAPAARLVRVERADDDRGTVRGCGRTVDEPLRHGRRSATAVANGLKLVEDLGPAEQLGHRAERAAAEVLVEAGGNDALAARDEDVDHEHDRGIEELHLVDPNGVVALGEARNLLWPRDGDRSHLCARVTDDVADVVAVVDLRLHDQGALAGDLGATEPANELFALAAEHRAADDLEPTAVLWEQPDHD